MEEDSHTQREVGRVEKGALPRGLIWTESPCDPEQRQARKRCRTSWRSRGSEKGGKVGRKGAEVK